MAAVGIAPEDDDGNAAVSGNAPTEKPAPKARPVDGFKSKVDSLAEKEGPAALKQWLDRPEVKKRVSQFPAEQREEAEAYAAEAIALLLGNAKEAAE